MNAIFTDNITDQLINYGERYKYDIKLLKSVNSKYHKNFGKYLNYKDYLNYKNVIVVTNDSLLTDKILNFNNENTIGVIKDTQSYNYSNITPFVKALYKDTILSLSINTDIIVYNNVSQFIALFNRIENFCKYVDNPYLFTISGLKRTTPNFLDSGLERELFTYFCYDMYNGFKLQFL